MIGQPVTEQLPEGLVGSVEVHDYERSLLSNCRGSLSYGNLCYTGASDF